MGEDSERRQFPRYPCVGSVEILQSEQRCGWGKVSDFSLGGCYIETAHPFPVGTEAHLKLTVANMLLIVDAKAVSATPLVGMGMEFIVMTPEQENRLAQIMEGLTATDTSPALQQAEGSEPNTATVQITREAAPVILAKILERVNEKEILTRQEILDIVKSSR
jgi:PilZ domain-containing protein